MKEPIVCTIEITSPDEDLTGIVAKGVPGSMAKTKVAKEFAKKFGLGFHELAKRMGVKPSPKPRGMGVYVGAPDGNYYSVAKILDVLFEKTQKVLDMAEETNQR